MDHTKSHYLELEQGLYSLRVHFGMCQGAKNEDVLDWSRFFLAWSQKAKKDCGSWSLENLRNIENFVKNLEKSKVGVMGYEVLERMMGEAAVHLNQEILTSLRSLNEKKVSLPA